jgi:pyridoxal phosphate enzyme (YggS family)
MNPPRNSETSVLHSPPHRHNYHHMTDAEIRVCLLNRLRAVEERIEAACRRAGRARTEVTLVAVTKTVGVQVARMLPELGVFDLGESRPQELWNKAEQMRDLPIRWHMIGHLQRNKVERTLPRTHLIHAVDSSRLLEEIDKQAKKLGAVTAVVLEVNASREPNKNGFAPEAVADAVAAAKAFANCRVEGLMTMAAYAENPESARPTFVEVRRLRERCALQHLSMGMTNDFEVAIEEGATLIRLGTVLFEDLP